MVKCLLMNALGSIPNTKKKKKIFKSHCTTGVVAHLIECLPTVHKTLDMRYSAVAMSVILILGKVKAVGFRLQSHPWLQESLRLVWIA